MTIHLLNDKAIIEDLGIRVKQKRLDRNWSQAALAEKSGISPKTVQKMEQGSPVSLATLITILRAFGSLDDILKILPLKKIDPIALMNAKSNKKQRASHSRKDVM